jgi:isocitrate/isopropylmalate dehydrogenase
LSTYRIALVPGDGVGGEVVAAARAVLDQVQSRQGGFRLAFRDYVAGRSAAASHGTALPPETLDGIRQSDAALLGALAGGSGPSATGELRKALDLYADVRPVKSCRGVWCLRPDIDIVFIRENTEGFLADRNLFAGQGEFMPSPDQVLSLRVLSRRGSERIARYAFEFARAHGRRKITVAHKANVLRMGCGFFLDVVRKVAGEYPDVELDDDYVDSIANGMIGAPERYDVVLTTNLFGDILSDEGSALVSNLVPTANIGPQVAVFRPVHEAKAKEAGLDIVNPLSAILCAAMMLRHLGESSAGAMVEAAVQDVLVEGRVKPRDLGGHSSTTDVTAAVCDKLIAFRG